MSINISQNDFNIFNQNYITKYIKLNLLDFNYNIVDELSGNMIECSVNVDANSDLRRSCKVSFVVTDSSFTVGAGSKIWLERYIQPFIGYSNLYTGEIQWYNQGIYLINSPTYTYDAVTHQVSFEGLDLMSKLTGVRNGYLQGIPTVISQGESVREAIISVIGLGGFSKYIVSECENTDGTIQEVPYDIEVDQGSTVYDLLSELRDILPQYQMYFDINGVFRYEVIPYGSNESSLFDDEVWDKILLSENVETDFETVKNYVEVYGKSHDITYYDDSASSSGGVVYLSYSGLTTLEEYTMVGFTVDDDVISFGSIPVSIQNENITFTNNKVASVSGTNLRVGIGYVSNENLTILPAGNIRLSVNSFGAYPLVDSNGVGIAKLYPDNYYVAQFQSDNTWLFLGHQQASGRCWDGNENSPFYVGAKYYSDILYRFTNSIILNLPEFDELPTSNWESICFTNTSPMNVSQIYLAPSPYLASSTKLIRNPNGTLVTSLEIGTYIIEYNSGYDAWILKGKTTPVIRQVLCGGDYDNIMSDDLAAQRAKLELYWRCRLNDDVTLSTIPIPWLDVNSIVSYTEKTNSNTSKQYMIESFSATYGESSATMNVELVSYYSYYY